MSAGDRRKSAACVPDCEPSLSPRRRLKLREDLHVERYRLPSYVAGP